MEEDFGGGLCFEEDVQGEVKMVVRRQAKMKVEQHLRNGEEVDLHWMDEEERIG